MIPPPRDAVIHQLARTAAEKIEAGHGQLDNFDSAVQIIEAALLHAQQVQRDELAPYIQHREGCDAEKCGGATSRGQCRARREAPIHWAPANPLKTYRHAFIETPCTCGLAAIRSQEAK